MSKIVEGDYQDEWQSIVRFSCGDTHIRTMVAFKQWNSFFIATDPLGGPWRGQGKTKEEAALEYIKQKLSPFDS